MSGDVPYCECYHIHTVLQVQNLAAPEGGGCAVSIQVAVGETAILAAAPPLSFQSPFQ